MSIHSYSKINWGSLLTVNGPVVPWTRTNPDIRNQWRIIAGRALVYSFPIWLYCDDISRNQSKKWNKHYSFLFSATGLPCILFQHEYNVHFLCTSNIAAPLEMMDGIIHQLEYICFTTLLGYYCLCPYMLWIPQGCVGHWGLGLGLCSWGPCPYDPFCCCPTWWQSNAKRICMPCWSWRKDALPHLQC